MTLLKTMTENIEQGCGGIVEEPRLLDIMGQIANGLMYLHNLGIVHRDLKLENVVRGIDEKWKIIDFGSCTTNMIENFGQLNPKEKEIFREEIDSVTTNVYQAPEQILINTTAPVKEKVDIWALGCITFTLMYHRH